MRPNPIIALAVVNYARVTKHISFGKFLYGWFEQLYSLGDIKDIPIEKRFVPIVDFTDMMQLFNWTNGVDQFIRTGDGSKIEETVRETERREEKMDLWAEGKKVQFEQLERVSRALTNAGLALATVRGHSMKIEDNNHSQISFIHSIRELKKAISEVSGEGDNGLYPLKTLIGKINEKFSEFGKNQAMDLYFAAEWCYKNEKIQQGYTFLEENIKTLLCRIHELSDNKINDRNLVSKAIHIYHHPIVPTDKMSKSTWDMAKIQNIIGTISRYGNLFKEEYNTLRIYRNNMNHASMDGKNLGMVDLKKQLKKLLMDFKIFFEEEGKKLSR